MTDPDTERRKERLREHFEQEYLPGANPMGAPAAEHRVANALEYIAHQAGKMREDISAIRAAVEKLAGK